jgi:hypothetical protein
MLTCLRFCALMLVLLAMPPTANAQQKASGTIALEVVKGGIGIGGASGSGMLTHEGRSYPITVGGLTFGVTVGVSRADLDGLVFGLESVEDIEGTYTQQQAAVVAGGGVSRFVLTNNKGVRLELNGREEGLAVALDLGGIEIAFKD